jgi:choline dehydrogenase-like flavoprotein
MIMKRREFLTVAAITSTASVISCGSKDSDPTTITKKSLVDYTQPSIHDVCVIGSGPAGCTAAEELLSEGKKVIMLESGLDLQTDSNATTFSSSLDSYSNSGEIQYPLSTSRIRALGGTSNIWTGRCPRLLPNDFKGNPLAPSGGWPISYEDIKPFYQAAEKKLRVTGDTLSAGHAPGDLPLPFTNKSRLGSLRDTLASLLPFIKNKTSIDLLRDTLAPLQIKADPPPTSRNKITGGPIRFYNILPTLVKHPNFTLISGATASSLESDSEGNISAVSCGFFDTNNMAMSSKIAAKQFIVACGALESTRLLLLSKNKYYPKGIGNHSGHLGRYFMEHPFVSYSADIPTMAKPERWGALVRTYQFSHDFNKDQLGDVLLGFYTTKNSSSLKIALGIEMSPESTNRLQLSKENIDSLGHPGLDLNFSFSSRDKASFLAGEKLIHKIFKELNSNQVTKNPELHWSHHHIGTTRMSEDPEQGVVDKNLKVHGTKNLYVASSSTFVTSGVANPTLTITALSLRLAKHLSKTG